MSPNISKTSKRTQSSISQYDFQNVLKKVIHHLVNILLCPSKYTFDFWRENSNC